MTDKKEMIKNSIYKASLLLPLCISLAVCGGLPSFYGLIVALIGAVLLHISPETDLSPTLLLFLVFLYANSVIGKEALPLCGIAGVAVCLIILAVRPMKKKLTESLSIGSLSLMTALFVTVFVTNSYFGIGAEGNTIIEMLKSYRSLGFHPNWRGILYGTIVMVVMITFPRKFKKGTKIVAAPFYALVITYILNLLLVSNKSIHPFPELGKPELKFGFDSSLIATLDAKAIIIITLSGIAAGIVFAYVLAKAESTGKAIISASASNAVSSVFGFPAVATGNTDSQGFVSGAIAAVMIAAVSVPTLIFARLPVSSAAVILIVVGWQNLDKQAIKTAFKKPLAIIGFLIAISVSAIYFPAAGVIIALLFSIITG